jgi:insulysin
MLHIIHIAHYILHTIGRSNASTSPVNTKYMLDVGPTHLHAALERMAAMFRAPLFTPSATGREVQAVHNEFAKNLNNDGRRIYQTLRSYANPKHPYSRFGTGNKETLIDGPAAAGINLDSSLREFYDRHYQAQDMTLVILGSESLDTLEGWAGELFGDIRNDATSSEKVHAYKRDLPPVFSAPGCENSPVGSVIKVVPKKDVRSLKLKWPYTRDPEVFRTHISTRDTRHL